MKNIFGLMLKAFPRGIRTRMHRTSLFYEKAAAGGIAEVAAGKLAQEKGAGAAVRDFGAMMVKDHGDAHAKLEKLATDKGVNLPAETDTEHKAMMRMLERKSGVAFDQAYVEEQILDHRKTAVLFEKEIASGKDADTKAFAREVLRTVQAHLQILQKMNPASQARR